MATFRYRARSMATGRLVQGAVEAETAIDLMEQLRQSGYVPLTVRSEGRLARWLKRLRPPETLGAKDLALSYRQLATMLHAGLPVVTALDVLAGQERGRIHDAARAVHKLILRGESLADAMVRSGIPFPAVHIDLIRAGELSGHLERVLERMAIMAEKEVALRGKVRSAALYPSVVLLIAVSVLIFMLVAVLPTFMGIFEELQAELPPLTRALLGIMGAVQRRWYLLLPLIVALVLIARKWAGTPAGRRTVDALVLRLPVFGRLSTNVILGSMARSLAMLLGAGLPLMQVLKATEQVVGNSVYRRALAEVQEGVNQGEPLAETLRWTGVVPSFMVEMVRVGEQAGSLEPMLTKVAEYYDRQTEEMVSNLSALLEPVLLVMIGGVVGLVLVALFLPILTLMNAVESGI